MNSVEIVDDIIGEVRTPPQPADTPNTMISEGFERANEHFGLYFTASVYENFKSLYNLVV